MPNHSPTDIMPLKIYKAGVIRTGPYVDSNRENETTASDENKAVAIIILGRSMTSKLDRNKASLTVLPACRCPIINNAAEPAKKRTNLSMDFEAVMIFSADQKFSNFSNFLEE